MGLLGVAIVLGAVALTGPVGCDSSGLLALFGGAMVAGALAVRLPQMAPISLLVAVLLPSWLACGGVPTVAVAFAGGLAGGTVRARAVAPAAAAAVAALFGVVLGDVAARGVATLEPLIPWTGERLVAGAVFVVAYWAGEWPMIRLAERLGVTDAMAAVPRSNVVSNLLLLFPGIFLDDLLLNRGLLLFGLMLALLLVALALIALYVAAEAARQGVAGEQARLRSIVAHVPDGIFAVGPDLKVEWLNETAGRLTGWEPTVASGREAGEVVQLRRADGTVADHRQAFIQAARSGIPVHTPGTLRAPDGATRPVVVSYTAVAGPAGGFEVGVGAVREADAEADEGVDDRAADLGHELRSPLSTILGYARLMSALPAGSLDAQRQAEFISRITESGDYMLRLVNNLLDLRRLESGREELQLAPIQVQAFVATALSMVQPRAAEKGLATTSQIEPGLPPLVTDELLARRALDNLLSNAVKYTPEGGSIRVASVAEGDGVAIAVADTGIGLSEEDQSQLFARFFRSGRAEARAERGTGLGLALVQESVRRLGGQIRVESTLGQGSTFTLWLPLRHPEAPAELASPAPAPANEVPAAEVRSDEPRVTADRRDGGS